MHRLQLQHLHGVVWDRMPKVTKKLKTVVLHCGRPVRAPGMAGRDTKHNFCAIA